MPTVTNPVQNVELGECSDEVTLITELEDVGEAQQVSEDVIFRRPVVVAVEAA